MSGNGGIFGKPHVVAADVGKDRPEEVSQERPQTGTETGTTMLGGAPEKPADELDSAREHKPADVVVVDEAKDIGKADEPAPLVVYTSGNMRRLKVGPYQFDNGVLKLTPEESVRFDKMLASPNLDSRMKHQIQKIDTASADKIGRDFLKTQRTRGIDTSTNRVA